MSNVVQFPAQSPPYRLGRYRILTQLGQGGMGTIHLAVAGGLGGFRKLFVVKELKHELTNDDKFLQLFMREARLAARLNHPNVVHTVEADQEDGRYYLAMEFLDGQPFSEILRRAQQAPAVPLALRLQVLSHALAGLHHAHEITDYDGRALHIVHRDVSPANIFVTYDGQVKVLDFGIAKAGEEGTQPGAFKGKIGYAAPEQLRMLPSDRRIDVFAAGVVLWEAIALRHLVRGRPSPRIFEARLMGTEPRIGQVVQDLDPALAKICDRAMSVDQEQRYPTAEAFRQELQDYLLERKLTSDAALITQFMRTKFADERGAMHRLIEEQLRDEGADDSLLARRSPYLLPPERRGPTTGVGEHVEYVAHNSAQPEVSERKSSAPLLIAAALVLVGGAWALRLRTNADQQRAQHTPAAQEAAPAQPAETEVAQPAEPAAGQPAETATEPPVKAAPLAPAALGTPSPAGPDAASAEPDEQSGLAHENADPRARAARLSPIAGRVPAKAGAAGEPAKADAGGRHATVPAREERNERVSPAGGAPRQGLDVDLRRIERPARRGLDLDNPFR